MEEIYIGINIAMGSWGLKSMFTSGGVKELRDELKTLMTSINDINIKLERIVHHDDKIDHLEKEIDKQWDAISLLQKELSKLKGALNE